MTSPYLGHEEAVEDILVGLAVWGRIANDR